MNLPTVLKSIENELAEVRSEINSHNPHAIGFFTALETLTELCYSTDETTRVDAAEILMKYYGNSWEPHLGDYVKYREYMSSACECDSACECACECGC